jgi:hypothetical protein
MLFVPNCLGLWRFGQMRPCSSFKHFGVQGPPYSRKASYVLLNVGAFQIHYTKQNFMAIIIAFCLSQIKLLNLPFIIKWTRFFYVLGTFYFICMLIIAFSHTSFLFTFVGLTNEVRWQARFSGRFDYDYIFL